MQESKDKRLIEKDLTMWSPIGKMDDGYQWEKESWVYGFFGEDFHVFD